jgi:cell division protein FtsL
MLGWDSLETVDRVHRWAEISGILILAFLVIAEVVAFKYNSRKDFLVSKQQTAEKQSHDDEMSRIHLETARITEHAAELDREAASLRLQLDRELQKRAPRHLTDLQAEALRNAISPLLGEVFVNIGTGNSSFEAVSFAQEIVHVVKSVRDKSASDSKDLTSITGLVRGIAVV